MKNLLVFLAVAVGSTAASWYSFGDSAHAMGMISVRGGSARHPVHLPAGHHRYTLVVTATVLPPFTGNARVTVDGEPELDATLYGSRPIIDLGLRHRPRLDGETFVGLRPRDRLTMWLVLRIPELDPVCGHRRSEAFESIRYRGGAVWLCSAACRQAFEREPETYSSRRFPNGTYHIRFTDAKTGTGVMSIPVIFGEGTREGGAAHEH